MDNRVKVLMETFSDLAEDCPKCKGTKNKPCRECYGHGKLPTAECLEIAERSVAHRKSQKSNYNYG
jgi:DnaJ-class molecular chaperone